MNPRQLAELHKEMAAVSLALRGEFDAEIKRLNEAIAEWDKRNNLSKERAQLDAEKLAHAINVQTLANDVTQHESRLNDYSDALDEREAKIKAREAELILIQNKTEQRKAAIEAEAATQKSNTSSLQAALSEKLAEVQERIDAVAHREALCDEREQKLKSAMKQVGALVG